MILQNKSNMINIGLKLLDDLDIRNYVLPMKNYSINQKQS